MTKLRKYEKRRINAKHQAVEASCAVHHSTKYYQPGFVRLERNEDANDVPEVLPEVEEHAEWHAVVPGRSLWLERFINGYMLSGNRSVISKIVMGLMLQIKKEYGQVGVCFVFEFLDRVRIPVYVRQRFIFRRARIESFILPWWKQFSLAMFWLKGAARSGSENSLSQNVLSEIAMYARRDLTSGVFRRRAAVFAIIHETRLVSHFRWRYV